MTTYRKEVPQTAGAVNRGTENSLGTQYSIKTEADTITIPLMHYLELIRDHQPESYQRAVAQNNIVKRIVQDAIKLAEQKDGDEWCGCVVDGRTLAQVLDIAGPFEK